MSGNPWDQDWGWQSQTASSQAPGAMPWDHDWSQGGPASFSWHLPTADEAGAFGSGAADALTLGFGDEAEGALAGAAGIFSGKDYASVYRQRVDEARARLEEARRLHPLSTMAGAVAGTAAAIALPGAGEAAAAKLGARGLAEGFGAARGVMEGERLPFGRALARMGAGGGPGAVVAQGARGALTGAAYGGVYGAGSGDGDVGQRTQNALGGAATGALFGAVTPFAFQGLSHGGTVLSPVWRAATGAGLGLGSSLFTGYDPGQSALAGAGVGLAGRPILGMAGPILAGVRRAWANPVAEFGPGRANAMIPGAPPIGGGGAGGGAAEPKLNPNAVRRMTDAFHRGRLNVDEVDAMRAASAAENARDLAEGRNPIVRRYADISPETSAELDTLANMPGESFTRANEIKRELASSLPHDLRSELRGYLGIRQTPGEMIDDMRAAEASANDGYGQVTSRKPVAAVVENRIAPLMETPEMQPVLARRFRVEQAQAQLARVNGEPIPKPSVIRSEDGAYHLSNEVTGQQLHRLKTSIDDELTAAVDRRSLSPAGRDEQSMLDTYRNTYLRALDDALPGYGDVRANRGSVFDLERSLRLDRNGNSTIGAHILKMDPEEITRFMREKVTPTGHRQPVTPAERRAYQTGVMQEVLQRIDDYVSAASDKVRNAGEVLDRVGLQNRLRAVFSDKPNEINAFLDRAIERAENLRRAASWTGNSFTARRTSRAEDQMADAMHHSAAHLATGNPIGAVGAMGKGAYNALFLRHLEGQNNAYGNALMTALSEDPESVALLRAIRKLQEERLARSRNAAIGGAEGAIGGGGHDQNNQGY